MKSYRVTATFPELPAAHAVQEARGEGSSLSVGIKRALDSILREPRKGSPDLNSENLCKARTAGERTALMSQPMREGNRDQRPLRFEGLFLSG
jgi:hypothetical protein